jgi:hypothetical protein
MRVDDVAGCDGDFAICGQQRGDSVLVVRDIGLEGGMHAVAPVGEGQQTQSDH